MIVSRALLAVLLLILGGMIYWVHGDIDRLTTVIGTVGNQIYAKIDTVGDKIDKLSKLQRSVAKVGKPRVPPVKYLVKPSTDACFPGS